MFLEYSDKLSEERTEIVYRYIHPISGECMSAAAEKEILWKKTESVL